MQIEGRVRYSYERMSSWSRPSTDGLGSRLRARRWQPWTVAWSSGMEATGLFNRTHNRTRPTIMHGQANETYRLAFGSRPLLLLPAWLLLQEGDEPPCYFRSLGASEGWLRSNSTLPDPYTVCPLPRGVVSCGAVLCGEPSFTDE